MRQHPLCAGYPRRAQQPAHDDTHRPRPRLPTRRGRLAPPGPERLPSRSGPLPDDDHHRRPTRTETKRRSRRPSTAVAVAVSTLALLPALTGCAPATPGGTLRSVDDTGLADTPIDEGWVLTLAADDDARWTLLHARPSDALDDLQTPADPDDVTALGGTWQPVRSGRFDLPADLAGPHLLCWAVPSGNGSTTATTRGCAEVALGDDARVEATWGEGGFGAQPG